MTMTAKIINLKQARKARTRAGKDEEAAQNRAAFGVPKSECDQSAAEAARARSLLDGAKRTPAGSDSSAVDTPKPGDGDPGPGRVS